MRFHTTGLHGYPPASARNAVYLEDDRWDDFTFKTLRHMRFADANGEVHDIGAVKIGEVGLRRGSPALPKTFKKLSEDHFSLGQDESYYSKLAALPDGIGLTILQAMNDLALDQEGFDLLLDEPSLRTSLLRGVAVESVRGQFHRIARGGGRLSAYAFRYTTPGQSPTGDDLEPIELTFEVQPNSRPPSNVHVIIGRNGVGKSFLLNNMTNTLVRGEDPGNGWFDFEVADGGAETNTFANVVSVAFSAFDDFEPLRRQPKNMEKAKYFYIGLKKVRESAETQAGSKSSTALTSEFSKSLHRCLTEPRRSRWRRAVRLLRSDPIFAEHLDDLLENDDDDLLRKDASEIFSGLSSGHKIVLLTLTRLVETVAEATLVLLDEPESHLHPPLLSAFVRSLSDLLEDRNGVAIIATHSPVILQEVPSDCVWKVRRSGLELAATRPEMETYGENVGVLTQEIFGLEVTASGFHRTLQESVENGLGYEEIVELFGGRLGSEARALVQTMTLFSDSR